MRGTAFEHLVTILFQLQTCNQNRNAVNASQWYNQQRSDRSQLIVVTKCDGSDLHPGPTEG